MKSAKNRRVLFAGESDDDYSVISFLLEFDDVELVSAKSIAEARKLADSDSFDGFLFDIHFQTSKSLKLCRRLRKHLPDKPILFYSGSQALETEFDESSDQELQSPNFNQLCETVLLALSFSDHFSSSNSESGEFGLN